ncbi:MAG: YdeI/OmpD-associated family protein [Flavisolibacter sp.]
MISFTAEIMVFGKRGEKTGWTYVTIPENWACKVFPNNKKSFRVKGSLDDCPILGLALLPMGNGNFILPLNAALCKRIQKRKGQILHLRLEKDLNPPEASSEFSECLSEDPDAAAFFQTLPLSHKNYYIKWIMGAKTDLTKAKRVASALDALSRQWRFNIMMQKLKEKI